MAMPPKSESSFIGIDLSGSKLRAATVNDEGVIGERREAPAGSRRACRASGRAGQRFAQNCERVSRRLALLYRVWLTGKPIA